MESPQSTAMTKAEFEFLLLELEVSDFNLQYFLSQGIPIWPSNKFTILYAKFKKKLMEMLHQNCRITSISNN